MVDLPALYQIKTKWTRLVGRVFFSTSGRDQPPHEEDDSDDKYDGRGVLADRRDALEKEYFHRKTQELLDAMKKQKKRDDKRDDDDDEKKDSTKKKSDDGNLTFVSGFLRPNPCGFSLFVNFTK